MADDAELELFRQNVSCAAVLERIGGWTFDVRESTRRALKYRRGAGEIIIVNHDSRGWWDATGSAKGDVFSLVQHLDPSLNFGEVRKVLRGLTGVSPSHPAFREPTAPDTGASPAERWTRRKPIVPADPAWRYLAGARALPAPVLAAAARQDCIRQGAYGSAWFAHRDEGGGLSHIEIRGPDFKGSLRGGRKTLFRFGESTRPLRRLAVLEAAIDALSLAAIEEMRADTLYVATGGGMGPGTVSAIDALLMAVRETGGVLLSGTDANATGDRYAERHAALAAEAGVGFARLRPPEGQDWNDVLRQGRGA